MIGREMVGAWKKNGPALLTRVEVEEIGSSEEVKSLN